jgi:hypothetical protein
VGHYLHVRSPGTPLACPGAQRSAARKTANCYADPYTMCLPPPCLQLALSPADGFGDAIADDLKKKLFKHRKKG